MIRDHFPGEEDIKNCLLQNSNYMSLMLKTNLGRDRRPDVVILECFNCRWEGGEVERVDRKDGRVTRWERWGLARWERWENGKVEKIRDSWFYSWTGDAGESMSSRFCF